MDGQVARREENELAQLMDKFVCVRLIQAYGADLRIFQFDPQLTWSVFMLNADKTIYGRYGTRSSHDSHKDISLAGFKKALQGALDLHGKYTDVKVSLAGKTGPAPRWQMPELMPALSTYKAGDTSRQGCIHCHKIHSGELTSIRKAGDAPTDRDLWVYPMPDVLGLSLDIEEIATVKSVAEGSVAEKSGFKSGDKISKFEGQPLLSISDVQWVLHQAPETGQIKAEVLRAGKAQTLTLALKPGWRRAGEYTWRSVGWTVANTVAGFRSDALKPEELKPLGLAENALGLKIKNIIPNWVKEGNKAVFKSGLLKGDVIVEVDGQKTSMNESEFLAYLVQKKKPGDSVSLGILRAGKTIKVDLPLQ
jgi:serine protease Do